MNHTSTDCRSEEGVTVGLIDAIMTMSRLLSRRNLSHPAVQEALKDLNADEDLQMLLETAARMYYNN